MALFLQAEEEMDVESLPLCSEAEHVIHPSLARKRTGDAEIGWRPTPEKNTETMPFWSEFAGAFAAQVHSLCASVTAVYLPFFVFGRVLTRLD